MRAPLISLRHTYLEVNWVLHVLFEACLYYSTRAVERKLEPEFHLSLANNNAETFGEYFIGRVLGLFTVTI